MSQPDMNQLMQQAQQMQAQLQEAQREIAASTVKGEAGNGLVTISVAGSGEVTDMEIDPKIVDPEDIDNVGWVMAAGAIGFVGNELVALYRIRVGRRIGSAALVADGLLHATGNDEIGLGPAPHGSGSGSADS